MNNDIEALLAREDLSGMDLDSQNVSGFSFAGKTSQALALMMLLLSKQISRAVIFIGRGSSVRMCKELTFEKHG